MKVTIEDIIEAIKDGCEPLVIINGEYYDIEAPEETKDEQ